MLLISLWNSFIELGVERTSTSGGRTVDLVNLGKSPGLRLFGIVLSDQLLCYGLLIKSEMILLSLFQRLTDRKIHDCKLLRRL